MATHKPQSEPSAFEEAIAAMVALAAAIVRDRNELEGVVVEQQRSIASLIEQLETTRAEAERSEKYAEERDLVAQQFEEQAETYGARLTELSRIHAETLEALLICRRYLLEDANGETSEADYYEALNATEIASNPASSPFPQPELQDEEGGLFGIKTYPGKESS